MKWIRYVVVVLLVLLVSIPSCGQEESPRDALAGSLRGRSFVVVVADSVHADHLSAYGYRRRTSPFLEELSAAGVRARRALSQTSWTLSSVTSLFTGLVQERHGVLWQTQILGADGPRTLAEMFKEAGYRTVGLTENGAAGPRTGLGRGFDRYTLHDFDVAPEEIFAEAEKALSTSFIEGGSPVFLYVHMLPPHMPYTPPEPYASMFREVQGSDVTGSITDVAEVQASGVARDHPDALRLVETYDEHVAYMDARVRRLVEPLLRDHGEDVCVLFTSDHGEGFLQHGAVGHNTFVYEEMVNVPWIFAAPGALPAGVELPSTVSLLDTLPTVAELFGLRAPARALDGESLVGTFAGVDAKSVGRELEPRELYLSSRYPLEGRGAQFALVEGRWKFVTRRRGALPQLFDTDVDPEEQQDVSEANPERMDRMAQRMGEIRTRLVEEGGTALSEPLSQTMLRDLKALGYGGSDLETAQPK
ncbi:Choline-sulfatase [Planctomycetes bacterium Poly30]|uniref:Choline-sulfatase n=1 Tax=Saltatorellus ferox TaxID=2528018 RepID=A0A518ENI4_9BACT|nr:Choline-sulfatase [Planctomycetes bacterium Poly30]